MAQFSALASGMVAGWGGATMTWTSWDGQVFDLTDPGAGIFVPRGGVRGLSMPPVKRFTSPAAGVPGSRYRSSRVDERTVFWPVIVASDESSADWAERDSAFFRSLRPDKTGTWTFMRPSGAARYLDCRFVDDGDATFDSDPHLFGVATYGINLVAEQPYWRGPRINRQWGRSTEIQPFQTTNPGEVIHISPGSTLTNSFVDNPGDVEGYMIWTLQGAFDSASVGTAGKVIEVPFPLSSNDKLVLDTRPDHLTAYQYAVDDDIMAPGTEIDRTDDLGSVVFSAIPPGEQVALSLNLINTDDQAVVLGSLDPLYYRAW